MKNQTIIFGATVVFLIAGLTGPTQSQMPEDPFFGPMTPEEIAAAVDAYFDRLDARSDKILARMWEELMGAAQQLIQADGRQWSCIRPLFDEILEKLPRTRCKAGTGYSKDDGFHWNTRLKGREEAGFRTWSAVNDIDKLTQPEQAIERLLALVVDENATDAQLKRGIEAVQRARSDAVEHVRQKQEELKDLLTHPRQEAFFLIINIID